MTVQELYVNLGEDYNEIYERIGNDKWIVKYLKKFIIEDYVNDLKTAIVDEQWEDLFKASHSLKGLALNLGLSKLANASTALCETVRSGAPTTDVTPLYNATAGYYNEAISQIELLD